MSANSEITDYITKCRGHGLPDAIITSNLLSAGWDAASVKDSFSSLNPPAAALPGYSSTTTPSRFPQRLVILAGAIVLILGLTAAGYILYGKFATSPEKLWAKAVELATVQESGTVNFAITYRETLPDNQVASNEADFFGNLELSAGGSSNFQKNAGSLDAEIKSKIAASLGELKFSLDAELRKVRDNFYYKINGDVLSALSGGLEESLPGSAGEWYQSATAAEDVAAIYMAIKNADIFTMQQYLDAETIDDQASAHFTATVDGKRLAAYLAGTALEKVITKLDFRKAEIWIGRKDGRIRQILLETDFPAFIGGYLEQASRDPEPRDQERLADILEISAVLAEYQKTNNRYPDAQNGLPILTEPVPFAPKPADGTCTTEQNLYWYEPQSEGQSYLLKFCLGSDTDGYRAGLHTATPSGILPPAEPDLLPGRRPVVLDDLPQTAALGLKLNFSNADEPQSINGPADAVPVP